MDYIVWYSSTTGQDIGWNTLDKSVSNDPSHITKTYPTDPPILNQFTNPFNSCFILHLHPLIATIHQNQLRSRFLHLYQSYWPKTNCFYRLRLMFTIFFGIEQGRTHNILPKRYWTETQNALTITFSHVNTTTFTHQSSGKYK